MVRRLHHKALAVAVETLTPTPRGDWLEPAVPGVGQPLLAPHRGPSRPEPAPPTSPRCQQPLQSSVLCACSSSGCHRPGPCPQAWLPHRAPRPGDAPVPAYSNAGKARRPVLRGHWPRRAAPGSRRGPRGDQPSPQPALGGPSQAALLQCLSSRGGAGKGSHPQPGRGSRAASLGLTVCAPFRAGMRRKAAFVPSYNTEKRLSRAQACTFSDRKWLWGTMETPGEKKKNPNH